MIAAFDMAAFGHNAVRLLVLVVPTAAGLLLARRRVVPPEDRIIFGLNAFVLYVCFPALIALGVLRVDLHAISGWGFWTVIGVTTLVAVAVGWLSTPLSRARIAGTTTLVLLFGNTAFIGIPFVIGVFGDDLRGPATVIVAVQVTIAVLIGPILLHRWSGTDRSSRVWRRALAQPLMWSPLFGIAMRVLPPAVSTEAVNALDPLAVAAAPTSMFVLGVHLARSRGDGEATNVSGVVFSCVTRLVVLPAVTLALCAPMVSSGSLEPGLATVFVVLAACPAAVSTFSIAENERVGAATVASTILWSGALCLVSLPLWAMIADAMW